MGDSSRRRLLIALPPCLLATTYIAFQAFTRAFGLPTGYLFGFLFYWLFWCAAVPFAVLGRNGVSALVRASSWPAGRARWPTALAVVIPLIAGYGYAFPRALSGASPRAILLSAVLAAVNGPLEELLWRGTYVAVFQQSRTFSFVYPNICFALWHFAPLSVIPNRAPGGSTSFVVASCVVGLLWGQVVLDSQSIRITSVAHALFDFSGLGGRLYMG